MSCACTCWDKLSTSQLNKEGDSSVEPNCHHLNRVLTSGVKENIFGFEVSVYDAVVVQVPKPMRACVDEL